VVRKIFGGRAALVGIRVEVEHAVRGRAAGRGQEPRTAQGAIKGRADDGRKPVEIGPVFIDAIDRPGAQGAHGEVGLAVTAHHDDRGRIAAGGELAEDLQPVEVGHFEVEEEEVKTAPGHRIQAAATRVHHRELGGGRLGKIEGDDLRNLRVVVGIEHAGHDNGVGVIDAPAARLKPDSRISVGSTTGRPEYPKLPGSGRVVP
jgi:hypothetical protein